MEWTGKEIFFSNSDLTKTHDIDLDGLIPPSSVYILNIISYSTTVNADIKEMSQPLFSNNVISKLSDQKYLIALHLS